MNWLIVVAGGKGERMDLGFNKVFARLGNHPLIFWTLFKFEKSKVVNKILISASKDDILKIRAIIKRFRFRKVIDIVPASSSRQESTFDVLEKMKPFFQKDDLVGVHNSVNPFVKDIEIRDVYKAAKQYGAALLAQAARDTVKITNDKGLVEMTPFRQFSWYAQTPQVATFKNLYKAHLRARKDGFVGTDDSQLLERIGIKPKIVSCSSKNIKITFPEDLITAKHILKTWTE